MPQHSLELIVLCWQRKKDRECELISWGKHVCLHVYGRAGFFDGKKWKCEMRRGSVLIEYDYTFNIFLAVKKTESSSPLSTQAEHPQGFLIPLDFSCNSLIHKLLGKFIAPILLHLRASNVFAVKMRGKRRKRRRRNCQKRRLSFEHNNAFFIVPSP